MERCRCGKVPIFKRTVGGPELRPEFKFECVCGESGIAGSNKSEAVYRWRRRAEIRGALMVMCEHARTQEYAPHQGTGKNGTFDGWSGRSATVAIVDEHATTAGELRPARIVDRGSIHEVFTYGGTAIVRIVDERAALAAKGYV